MHRYRELAAADTHSLSSLSTVDASFCSAAGSCFSDGSSSSFEIESEVGREALIQICCSSLSRLLDFPDSQLEILLGSDDEQQMSKGEDDGGMNVARYVVQCVYHDTTGRSHNNFSHYRNIASSLRMMKRSIGSGLHAISHMYHHQRHHTQGVYHINQGEY